MKDMSNSINSIIEKKLKKPAKELPLYSTKHLSNKLKKSKSEIDKVYKQN